VEAAMAAIRRVVIGMALLAACVAVAAWVVAPKESRMLLASISHAVQR